MCGPPFPVISKLIKQWPYLPLDWTDSSLSYNITLSLPNAISITTVWLDINQRSSWLLSNGSVTAYGPSAFMAIQIPFSGTTNSSIFMCSVDARWIEGARNVASQVGGGYDVFRHEVQLLANGFLSPNGKKVEVDMDWLKALTPPSVSDRTLIDPSNAGRSSTFSNILQGMDLGNATGSLLDGDYFDIQGSISNALSLVFADGMSRVGYTVNGGSNASSSNDSTAIGVHASPAKDEDFVVAVLNGEAELVPNSGGTDPSNTTKYTWSATVTGLSYKADNVGTLLAIAVLLVHATVAIAHTIYIIISRRTSESWDTFSELLVIAENSLSPALKTRVNTSAGIERMSTSKRPVRIRAVTNDTPLDRRGNDELQMIVEEVDWDPAADGYEKVALDRVYGRRLP